MRAAELGNINRGSLDRMTRVIGRSGFSIVGALCGLFVADQMARTPIAAFDSVVFFVATMASGIAGFYLRIDVPLWFGGERRTAVAEMGPELNAARAALLSAAGTFATAVAALMSVAVLVLDGALPLIWTALVGLSWLAGVTMQIAAAIMMRPDPRAARPGDAVRSAKPVNGFVPARAQE